MFIFYGTSRCLSAKRHDWNIVVLVAVIVVVVPTVVAPTDVVGLVDPVVATRDAVLAFLLFLRLFFRYICCCWYYC